MSDLKTTANKIHARYLAAYCGEIQGCCPVIADDIIQAVGGEAVAGYLCFGGVERSHWWVEKDGVVLDPMGDDLLSYERHGERREEHRDQTAFRAILEDYEQWRL